MSELVSDDAFDGDGHAAAAKTFESLNQDMSAGELPRRTLDETTIAAQEWRHRQSLQQSIFSIAVSFAAFLYMAAVTFAAFSLHFSSQGRVDWHVWLVVASFIIPPTILILALIRGTYGKNEKLDPSDYAPSVAFAKEAFAAALEAVKRK